MDRTATGRLSVIWKSNLTNKIKRSFFQAAVVSKLLYGCTTWTLIKRMETELDGNNTRMLRAVLNKSWRQRLAKQQLYNHLPLIPKTIQIRRTRHVGHCWRSRDELESDILLSPLHMHEQRQENQLESINNSSVPIQDIAWETSRE